MTLYETCIELLENNPSLKERRFRARELSKYLLEKVIITPQELEEILSKFASMDRYIRMAQKDRKDLRGEDYNDKRKYEELAQLNFGYESGYHQNVAKLKTI